MNVTSPFLRRLAGRIAILLAAGTLAACQVEVDQGGGGYRPGPQACTRDYRPVCGVRGGDQQTFANACEARESGFRVAGPGECRRDGGRPEPYPDPDRACTREYAPVCGSRGRDRQTFANACEARKSGYDIMGRGECQFGRPDRDRPGRDRDNEWAGGGDGGGQRMCTMEYNPVCAQRGRDLKTFGNSCSADAAGYRVVRPGECQSY